jgi:hypothetical protein
MGFLLLKVLICYMLMSMSYKSKKMFHIGAKVDTYHLEKLDRMVKQIES